MNQVYDFKSDSGHYIERLTDVIRVLNPLQHGIVNDQNVRYFETDSRNIQPGDVYVAVIGNRVDGHVFVNQAIERGALACLVSSKEVADTYPECILVPDTLQALAFLAAKHRRSLDTRFIGLTGSVGKTTTKELLFTLIGSTCRARRSEGNRNSTIGLPMEILKLRHGDDWMVAEMGMSTAGEIAFLMDIAKPELGLLLSVRAVHLANFTGIDQIAAAKGELVTGLDPDATLIYNQDDYWVRKHATQFKGKAVSFGIVTPGADVRGRVQAFPDWEGTWFEMVDMNGASHELYLPMVGRFNVQNALAACATALTAGFSIFDIKHALAGAASVGGRCRVINLNQGLMVDDTYNSNPHAVDSVLRSFASLSPKHYRWIILGDMLEMGEEEMAIHEELGKKLATYGFDRISLVGPLCIHAYHGLKHVGNMSVDYFEDSEQAAASLGKEELPANVRIWCKASRGIALEKVCQVLSYQDSQTE